MQPVSGYSQQKLQHNHGIVTDPSSALQHVGGQYQLNPYDLREQDWRNGAVVYQVFVDRFAPSADLEKKKHLYGEGTHLKKWTDLPVPGPENKEIGYWQHEVDFWGGDLQSLKSKMDYICSDLDIDILYLQPISTAYSNHKYDTTDYMKVDPQYGTEEDFQELVKAVHDRQKHLVLDGVFNHLGKRSEEFQKAQRGEANCEWFFLGKEYGPDGYKCWSCAPNLVELRLEAPSCQDYFWMRSDSVIASWLKRGSDGWRLDVASEIGYNFLRSITDAAHRHKPGSLIVGEVWAFPSKWNKAMDGTLSLHNGQVLKAVALGDCPGPTAALSLKDIIEKSSLESMLKCWIVMSNHDMERLATSVKDVTMRKLALSLAFTIPGSPLIYYGDERGMQGGDDPANRGTMQWDELGGDELSIFSHVKKLIQIRKRLRALRIGDYTVLHSQKLMAFMRTTDKVKDTVVVLANGSDQPVKEMVIVPISDILGHTQIVDELVGPIENNTRILGATICVEIPPKSIKIYSILDASSPSEMQYKRIPGHFKSLESEGVFPLANSLS